MDGNCLLPYMSKGPITHHSKGRTQNEPMTVKILQGHSPDILKGLADESVVPPGPRSSFGPMPRLREWREDKPLTSPAQKYDALPWKGGDPYMEGGIYAEDKCPVCSKKFVHDPNRGFICQEHKTRSTRLRVRFRGIRRRFNNYEDAHNFLAGVRFKAQEGSFDKRDYLIENPLGFANQAKTFLKTKEKLKSYRDVRRHIKKAEAFFLSLIHI